MKKQRRRQGFLPLFIVFLLSLALGGLGLLYYENQPTHTLFPDSPSEGIAFEDAGVSILIEPGLDHTSVGKRLKKSGLIRSELLWKLLPRVFKKNIKTGEYLVEIPISTVDLYLLLCSGRVILKKITIPEGMTAHKIAQRLAATGICTAEDFIQSLKADALLEKYKIPAPSVEGYLFPETYYFPKNYPSDKLVDEMLAQFFKVLDHIAPENREETPETRHEKIILASIVEREAALAVEAPLIAGVFYNRLNISMPLQSCATVEYIITEIQNRPHPKKLFDVDIAIDHPYNTYLYRGLPPGPIANPGRTALKAVYAPQSSDYLYFRLVDAQEGKHAFSKTYNQHLEYGLLLQNRGY